MVINMREYLDIMEDIAMTHAKLEEYRTELKDFQMAYAKKKYGVEIGSIVIDGDDVLWKVNIIIMQRLEKPALRGYKANKNGEFNGAHVQFHVPEDWEIYEP